MCVADVFKRSSHCPDPQIVRTTSTGTGTYFPKATDNDKAIQSRIRDTDEDEEEAGVLFPHV